MRKFLKFFGWTLLILILLGIGFGIYAYRTNDMLRAIIKNDESRLYYFPKKELADLSEFNYSEYELNVEDTIKVFNYHFKPQDSEHKGNIFFIHGRGGNASACKNLIKPLVKHGFEVYAIDWRGYGKSTGIPNYKNVLKDTELSFKDFLSKTKNDSVKTIVYGLSLGGQLAVKIAKDNQNTVDALILDGSIPSAQQMAVDFAPVAFLKERIKEHPENFNQDYVAIRDIKDIKTVPKLIIHSRNDREVLFEHGEDLYKNAKEPKEFWETDTKHVMTLADYPNETIQKINNLIR